MSSSPAFESFKLPSNISHPIVLSRLRPCKRKSISLSPLPATLTRYTQTKRARRRYNLLSPPLALSSPYHITVKSSLYIFNEEFYTNNPSILNTAINTDITNYRTIYNHYIKRLREAHERIINSAILEAF
jgi:hypothetical protein